jgi:hypothetical protein
LERLDKTIPPLKIQAEWILIFFEGLPGFGGQDNMTMFMQYNPKPFMKTIITSISILLLLFAEFLTSQ